jgi:hypothetical protein
MFSPEKGGLSSAEAKNEVPQLPWVRKIRNYTVSLTAVDPRNYPGRTELKVVSEVADEPGMVEVQSTNEQGIGETLFRYLTIFMSKGKRPSDALVFAELRLNDELSASTMQKADQDLSLIDPEPIE